MANFGLFVVILWLLLCGFLVTQGKENVNSTETPRNGKNTKIIASILRGYDKTVLPNSEGE